MANATLLRAIEDYESRGNTVEEFGVLLAEATTPRCLDRKWQERRTTARAKLRALDGGEEVLKAEAPN